MKERLIPITDCLYPTDMELVYKLFLGEKEDIEYIIIGDPTLIPKIDRRIKELDLPFRESNLKTNSEIDS